jgi:hypothetical protein
VRQCCFRGSVTVSPRQRDRRRDDSGRHGAESAASTRLRDGPSAVSGASGVSATEHDWRVCPARPSTVCAAMASVAGGAAMSVEAMARGSGFNGGRAQGCGLVGGSTRHRLDSSAAVRSRQRDASRQRCRAGARAAWCSRVWRGTGWHGLRVLGVSRAVLGEGRGELGLGWGSRRDARPGGVTRRARGRAQGCGTGGGRGEEGKGRKEKEE